MLAAIVLSGALLCGCGGPVVSSGSGSTGLPLSAQPTLTTGSSQNGAVIVSLTSTDSGATILYTVDGSLPDAYSSHTITYQAPFLVASNLTVKAVATAPGHAASRSEEHTSELQ